MARFAIPAVLVAVTSLRAQTDPYELLLRDGTVITATAIVGEPAAGLEVEGKSGKRRLGAHAVLAVQGGRAAVTPQLAAHLAGGDVLRGSLWGGDAGGNRLLLLSPVFGQVPVAVDRIATLTAAGIESPRSFVLPEGVDEALFVRANIGFDVVSGALHQFGEQGVRFEVGNEAPRWFRPDEFAALQLRGAAAREGDVAATLQTRVGDRVGVGKVRWTRDGLACELEGGTAVAVRAADLASITFHHEVVFLSDLEPSVVQESGFDGEVVHPFRRDQNVLGAPLVCAGRTHGKGLGAHSRSRLSFVVPPGCDRFWTRVGFDDSAMTLGLEPRADVRVSVGEKVVFEQKDLAPGQAPRDTGLVVVRPGETVTLAVDPGKGRDLGDRIDWLGAMFLPAAARKP